MSEHGITLEFKDQLMTWDETTINLKESDMLSELFSPINELFKHVEFFERLAFPLLSSCPIKYMKEIRANRSEVTDAFSINHK
jgi:hypothetical protein